MDHWINGMPGVENATPMDELTNAIHRVANAIYELGSGDAHGPGAIEALSMSLCGEGKPGHSPITQALRDIADAIDNHGDPA